MKRRGFLRSSFSAAGLSIANQARPSGNVRVLAAAAGSTPVLPAFSGVDSNPALGGGGFKLGLVTYNLAKDWDIPTLIKNCVQTGLEAVELRTTHTHGVEPSLSRQQRLEVKQRFADTGVQLLSLGSTCEYHSPDAGVVKKNIEETKRFIELAHDIGALGVKVRPNGIPREVPEEKTLEQIGKSLQACGQKASGSECISYVASIVKKRVQRKRGRKKTEIVRQSGVRVTGRAPARVLYNNEGV